MGNRQGGKLVPRSELSGRYTRLVKKSNDGDPMTSHLNPGHLQPISFQCAVTPAMWISSSLHQHYDRTRAHDPDPGFWSSLMIDDKPVASSLPSDLSTNYLHHHTSTISDGSVSDGNSAQGTSFSTTDRPYKTLDIQRHTSRGKENNSPVLISGGGSSFVTHSRDKFADKVGHKDTDRERAAMAVTLSEVGGGKMQGLDSNVQLCEKTITPRFADHRGDSVESNVQLCHYIGGERFPELRQDRLESNVQQKRQERFPDLRHDSEGHIFEPSIVCQKTSRDRSPHLTLDNLERSVQPSQKRGQTLASMFPHFTNTGSAQLRHPADQEVVSEPETSTQQRVIKSGLKTTVTFYVPQCHTKTKPKPVRKLSEPCQRVLSTEAWKTGIPITWSKSAENSPVIVRRALPRPSSPVMVQRTPSHSPCGQRRFPANAANSPGSPTGGPEFLHTSVASTPHSQTFIHSTSQKHAEVAYSCHRMYPESCAPVVSRSPGSFRKMPDSPVLLLPMSDLTDSSGRESSPDRSKPCHPVTSRDKTPSGLQAMSLASKTIPPPRTHQGSVQQSSCSSSSSSSLQFPQRLPSPAGKQLVVIPTKVAYTSMMCQAPGAVSAKTPDKTPAKTATVCCQPKGTPVKEHSLLSKPCTAVVLPYDDSEELLLFRSKTESSSYFNDDTTRSCANDCILPSDKSRSHGKDHVSSSRMCTGQGKGDTVSSAKSSPATQQTGSMEVTEDTIKQNSQSAVFGSVSPKLMRQRRWMKGPHHSLDTDHTAPTSHSPWPELLSSRREDNASTDSGDNSRLGLGDFFHRRDNGTTSPLPKYSIVSPLPETNCRNNTGFSLKTLGQRIKDVIQESTSKKKSDLSSSSFGKCDRFVFRDTTFDNISVRERSFSQSCTRQWTRPTKNSHHVTTKGRSDHEDMTDDDHEKIAIQDCRGEPRTTTACAPHYPLHLSYRVGHSYHLNSFSETHASHCNDCQPDCEHNPCVRVSELTEENLTQKNQMFSRGLESGAHSVLVRHLGVPGRHLVTSDTTDTLSTDRDTSGSSKRESSTSTATDDTLTSLRTRSDSEFEEGCVLPQTLVFTHSALNENMHQEAAGGDWDQSSIKRKLPEGRPHGLGAFCGPPALRKRRRKQLLCHSGGGAKPVRGVLRQARAVYSDEVSEDSFRFSGAGNISNLTSSRDDISEIVSSADDISELISSRDDISDLNSSRDDISELITSKDDISHVLSSRDDISELVSSRDDISDLIRSRDDASELLSSRDDISDVLSSREDMVNLCESKHTIPNPSSTCKDHTADRLVFHRSDLQTSVPHLSPPGNLNPLLVTGRTVEDRWSDSSLNSVGLTTKSTSRARDSVISDIVEDSMDCGPWLGDSWDEGNSAMTLCESSDVVLSGPSQSPRNQQNEADSYSDQTRDAGSLHYRQPGRVKAEHFEYGYNDQGKQLSQGRSCAGENTTPIVMSYTIYNSNL